MTAAMDEMAFLQPVQVGDILRTYAQVNWAGRSSMEIGSPASNALAEKLSSTLSGMSPVSSRQRCVISVAVPLPISSQSTSASG